MVRRGRLRAGRGRGGEKAGTQGSPEWGRGQDGATWLLLTWASSASCCTFQCSSPPLLGCPAGLTPSWMAALTHSGLCGILYVLLNVMDVVQQVGMLARGLAFGGGGGGEACLVVCTRCT